MMNTLSLGTVPLDPISAAVHAVQDRHQREPDRELNLGTTWCIRRPRRGASSSQNLGAIVIRALSLGAAPLNQHAPPFM